MKTLMFLLLSLCIGVGAIAQDHNEEPYLVKILNGADIRSVLVQTSGGSISVDGGSQTAKVEVYVHGNNPWNISKDEIKERLEKYYDLQISGENHELKAIAKNKEAHWFNNHSLNISFKIYVPSKVTTDLTTSGGSIHIANLDGDQRFVTSGGSLHVDHILGKIKGNTSGGSIHVSNSKPEIEMETSGGSIEAENCEGHIRLTTSGGSLNLNHLRGNIQAETSGGSIRGGDVSGELNTATSGGSISLTDMACSLKASTSGGSVNVQMKKLGNFLRVYADGGHADVELPADGHADLNVQANRVNASNLEHFAGEQTKEKVIGKLNGGGTEVTVRASSGHANIKID